MVLVSSEKIEILVTYNYRFKNAHVFLYASQHCALSKPAKVPICWGCYCRVLELVLDESHT